MAKLEKIGKYEILGQIAAGGFGVVYKARDPFIKRLVAIKTCPADNEDLRNRFFREAEIVGNLKHPNVTIVHDFGVEGDFAYLVQEYLSGEDLLAKIRDKRALELSEKLEILLQVAQGLGYAHGQGVIHRDVKPGNIRVLEDGRVKIMDFGIAKLITARTQLTQKGMTVGTVGYLSPEQVSDGEVTQRTDIFGFGVLSYEFLTYRRPFRGRTLGELIPRIVKEIPPAVSTLVVDAPAALDAMVARCLAKNPADRFASFEEVVADLGGILSEAQLVAALPGDVVERTVRLDTSMSSAPQSHGAPAATPAVAMAPEPVRTPEPPSTPEPARAPFDDTRPVILEEELREAAAAPLPPAEPRAPAVPHKPHPPAGAPSAAQQPARARMPSPDPDLSMSGFAPPPLPVPPGAPPSVAAIPAKPSRAEVPAQPGGAAVPVAEEPPVLIGGSSVESAGLGVGRLVLVALAGLIFLGGLAGAGWYLLTRDQAVPEEAPPEVVATVPTPAPPPPVSVGRLVINAVPWGVVERIVSTAGEELPGAPFGATPRVVEVPPGSYRVEISHPDLPAPVVCEVEVAGGAEATCAATTAALDVNTYFREAGWWR